MRNIATVLIAEIGGYWLFYQFLQAEELPRVLLFLGIALIAAGLYALVPAIRPIVNTAFAAQRRLAIALLLLLIAAFPYLIRTSPYWLFSIALACLYVAIANGLNLQTGTTGLINLAGAAFYGTGAYVAALLAVHLGVPGWLTLPIGAVTAMIISALLFVPVLRIRGHYLALVTIAFGVIFNITLNNTEAVGGPQGVVNIPGFTILSVDFNSNFQLLGERYHYYTNYFYLAILVAILAIWVARKFINSPAGLVLNSIRDDEWAAKTAGVQIATWKMIGWCAGSALIGIAGAAYAHMVGYVAPADFAFEESLFQLSMVILGGMNSVPGVSIAAVLLVLLTEKLRVIQDYRFLLYGLLVVAMLIFRPQGLIPAGIRSYFPGLARNAGVRRSVSTEAVKEGQPA